MSSSIGQKFKVSTFGESHGCGVGAVIDGCPAGFALVEADIQPALDRRRPGQSAISTPRQEADRVQILSGVENGSTLGSPIALYIENQDQRPDDYRHFKNVPRPSHADFTYWAKYGIRSRSGGGRASARETAGRVAAGAVAEKYLAEMHDVDIVAWVSAVGQMEMTDIPDEISRDIVDRTPVRCPDQGLAEEMIASIKAAAEAGDSLGGIVTCVCRNVPVGLGEPVFDKAEALLARAMLSIPASKGFDIGSGFAGTRMLGSNHNDVFVMKDLPSGEKRLGTVTNRSGGIQGGITNGEDVLFRVAFKPVATIRSPQDTVDYDGNKVTIEPESGRHDPCVVPRAVPIVEGMAAIVLADLVLLAGK